jgi:hypothetical protein
VALEFLLGIEGVAWAGSRFPFAHSAHARVRAFPMGDALVFGLVQCNVTSHLPPELVTY